MNLNSWNMNVVFLARKFKQLKKTIWVPTQSGLFWCFLNSVCELEGAKARPIVENRTLQKPNGSRERTTAKVERKKRRHTKLLEDVSKLSKFAVCWRTLVICVFSSENFFWLFLSFCSDGTNNIYCSKNETLNFRAKNLKILNFAQKKLYFYILDIVIFGAKNSKNWDLLLVKKYVFWRQKFKCLRFFISQIIRVLAPKNSNYVFGRQKFKFVISDQIVDILPHVYLTKGHVFGRFTFERTKAMINASPLNPPLDAKWRNEKPSSKIRFKAPSTQNYLFSKTFTSSTTLNSFSFLLHHFYIIIRQNSSDQLFGTLYICEQSKSDEQRETDEHSETYEQSDQRSESNQQSKRNERSERD